MFAKVWHGYMVHKDLKPSSILLLLLHPNSSHQQAKISGLGLARKLDKCDDRGENYTIFCNAGTLYYIAPECFLTGRSTRSSDVYAFGIILHNCFITQDEARTYNARQVLGNGIPSDYSKVFIDRLVHDHLRPDIPATTRMSPEVAEVILPMIRECIADEDMSTNTAAATEVMDNQQQSSSTRRPTFENLLKRLDGLLNHLQAIKSTTTSSPPATVDAAFSSADSIASPDVVTEKASLFSPTTAASQGTATVVSSPTPTCFQPLTALNKIKELMGIDSSVSAQEAIDLVAKDLGLTGEFVMTSTLKGRVRGICCEMSLDETKMFDPSQCINEKDDSEFITALVSSSMKHELDIVFGMPVKPTLTSFAKALGIDNEDFFSVSLNDKAKRIAEELGILSRC